MNKRVSVRRYIVKHKHLTFLLPGFLGLIIFYFLPFFITVRFSLSDTAGKGFAGFKQYKELINSSAFRLAAGHSTIMALAGCVLLIPLSLYLASRVNKMERFRKLCQSLMLLPMVIPSADHVYESFQLSAFRLSVQDQGGCVRPFFCGICHLSDTDPITGDLCYG